MQFESAFANKFAYGLDGLHDAFPASGQIQAGYLKGLKTVVHNLGGDPHKVLERHDIDPFAFDNPDHHLDCAAAVNLLEYCSRALGDPLFGMRLAEQQDPEVFGCVTALSRAAPDLREALQSLIDYVPVSASPECEMEMVKTRDVVELRWRTHSGLVDCAQSNFQGLLVIMKTLHMLGREDFRPRYATLTFGVKPLEVQQLQDRLGCRVKGKSEANAIAFSADLLDRPIATSNRVLFNLLGNYLAQLRSTTRSSFVEQVGAQVLSALSAGKACSVDSCADKLGTSGRTLQKRLLRTGVKFSDIVQNERIKLAKHALLWSDCSLDEIAFRLGYSEQTSFGRAFRRSTGMTPHAFRSSGNRSLINDGPLKTI